MLLSVCMIVKNEEENLPRALTSVKGVADELIVVDTGSTDRTVQIAESFGAKVHHYPWNGDFSAARNFAMDKATGQWLFLLDADEELSETDRDLVRPLLSATGADGLYINCLNYVEGDIETELFQYAQLRLVRNKPNFRYEGVIHEQLAPSLLRNGAKLELTPLRINHYGYLKKSYLNKDKIKRNISIIEKELRRDPHNSFMLYNLGLEYMRLGEYERAVNSYVSSYKKLKKDADGYAPMVVRNMCVCLYRLGRYEDILKVIEDAENIYPGYTDLTFQKGLAFFQLGRFDLAMKAFRKCLLMGESRPGYLSTVGVGGTRSRVALGQVYERIGEYESAVQEYTSALQQDPNSLIALAMLATLLCRFEPVQRVHDFFQKNFPSIPAAGLRILADLFAKNRGYDLALEYLDRAVTLDPDKPNFLLRAEYLMLSGQPTEARAVLAHIQPEADDYEAARITEVFCHVLEGNIPEAKTVIEGVVRFSTNRARTFIYQAFLDAIVNRPFPEIVFDKDEELLQADKTVWQILARLIVMEEFELFEKALSLLKLLPCREAEKSLRLGKLYYRYGFRDSAFEELATALEAGVYDHDGLFYLAGMCAERGHTEDAITFYYRCIGLDPKDVASYVSLARLLHDHGREQEANRVLDMGLKEVPGSGFLVGMKQAVSLAV